MRPRPSHPMYLRNQVNYNLRSHKFQSLQPAKRRTLPISRSHGRRPAATRRRVQVSYKARYLLLKKSIEEATSCTRCHGPAFQPQILPCGHIFCARCTAKVRRQSVRKDKTTQCEDCRAYVVASPAPGHALKSVMDALVRAEGVKVQAPRKLTSRAIWMPRV